MTKILWWAGVALSACGGALATWVQAAGADGGAATAAASAAGRPVKLGVLTDNYPFSFRGEHGHAEGFVFDLANEIEAVMGLRFERMEGATEDINGAFRSGRIEVLQSYAQFAEREAHADFSVPYLTMSGAIFVRAGLTGVRELADLRGHKVLVHRGSMGEALLLRAGLGDTIVPVASVEQALVEVDAGRGDATLVTRLSGLAAAQHLGLTRLRVVDAPVPNYEVRYCFAVQEGDRELLAKLNEGLAILVRVGTFERIYRKWFGRIEPTRYSALQITLAITAGLAVALAVMIWAAVRQKRLQRRIERQAEVLRSSEERYRTVFDGEQDGLLVLGGATGVDAVEQINPAARKIIGDAAERTERRTLREWLGAEPELCAHIEAVVTEHGATEFEHETTAGGRFWRVGLAPLGRGALVRLTDVTEAVRQRQRHEQQEAQIRNAQKLEAIGTLAGGVAHDFNNLLTVIMGNAELSLLGLAEDSPEAEHLRKVLEAARRARQLVRQVLTFSKRTEPTRERLAAGPVIDEMLSFLRSVARDAVEFEHRREEPLPEIVADSAQLHQVLMNVGTNAIQAMRGTRGRLTIVEEVVTIADEMGAVHPELAAGRYVRIGFRDTGPGMAADVLARIFEPYFTTKGPGEGTGLGLSVVHGIMQQHGGAVTVYSQVGRGTIFHLYFPVAPAGGGDDTSAFAAVPKGAGQLALLVDDDAAVARTAQQILERLGYRVSAHLDAAGALEEFARRPGEFGFVLTDLAMPGTNGLALVERVRRLRSEVPTIVMSGFFSRTEETALAAAGVAHRLHKPLTYVSVGRVIATVLSGPGG